MRTCRRRNAASAQEAFGELLETLVSLLSGAGEDARDVGMQPWLPPTVSGGFFRITGGAIARRLEQRRGSRCVEFRIVPRRKREATTRPAAGVLVDERSRH